MKYSSSAYRLPTVFFLALVMLLGWSYPDYLLRGAVAQEHGGGKHGRGGSRGGGHDGGHDSDTHHDDADTEHHDDHLGDGSHTDHEGKGFKGHHGRGGVSHQSLTPDGHQVDDHIFHGRHGKRWSEDWPGGSTEHGDDHGDDHDEGHDQHS